MIIRIFIDQIDADEFAEDFMMGIIEKHKPKSHLFSIDHYNLAIGDHVVDGNVISLWYVNKMVAMTSVQRTPLNWSQVICQEIE